MPFDAAHTPKWEGKQNRRTRIPELIVFRDNGNFEMYAETENI